MGGLYHTLYTDLRSSEIITAVDLCHSPLHKLIVFIYGQLRLFGLCPIKKTPYVKDVIKISEIILQTKQKENKKEVGYKNWWQAAGINAC